MAVTTLVTVKSARELRKFVDFPSKLYEGCPFWVPELRGSELKTLSGSNPALEFCKLRLVLAYRGREVVGRIAGIINPAANKKAGVNAVRFGWIDFIDDINVARMLTDDISRWGAEQGMTCMKGPVGFTNMDRAGLLVEGFDTMASFTCIYNYPYYHEILSQLGFVKDADWTAKIYDIPSSVPERLVRMSDVVEKRYGFHVFKPHSRRQLLDKGAEVFRVLNDAWVDIYGSSRLNDRQVKASLGSFAPVMDRRYVCLVLDRNERVAGFGICIPSITPAIKKCGGRLFPFGFVGLLKAMRRCDTVEALLIGVLPQYHGKGVPTLITKCLHESFISNGVTRVLANPQLEDNLKAQSVFAKDYQSTFHNRRRSYTKEIG